MCGNAPTRRQGESGSVLFIFFCHTKAEPTLCWRGCLKLEAEWFSGGQSVAYFSGTEKAILDRVSKTLENAFTIGLPSQFSSLFLGCIDFQAGLPGEYLLGIVFIACKKAITRHWVLP